MYALATLATILLPASALLPPASLAARAADDLCAPISYTLRDYSIYFTPNAGTIVDFTVTSSYSDKTVVTDLVQNTIDCNVSNLQNSNACLISGNTLSFDLRGSETTYSYELLHEWTCNKATWHAATAIQFQDVTCNDQSSGRVCTAGPLTVTPQNVIKECSGPTNC